MAIRFPFVLLCVVCVSSCGDNKWPDPPPVDQATYQQEYTQLAAQQRETAVYALSLIGAWQLDEGDTPFGSDPGQPIVLPTKAVAPRAGVLRRSGDAVTVIPEQGVRLTREDGSEVTSGARLDQG